MDKSNRWALRIVGLTAVLVMLGAVKVINVFNQMIQPPEPMALVQLHSIRERLQQTGAELTGRLKALPVEKIKTDLWEVGMETQRQMLIWWEGLVRTTRDDVASKKR